MCTTLSPISPPWDAGLRSGALLWSWGTGYSCYSWYINESFFFTKHNASQKNLPKQSLCCDWLSAINVLLWWNSFLKHDQPIFFCNFIVFNFTSQAETGNSALFLSLLQGWPRPGPCFLFVSTLCVVIMMLTTICNDKNCAGFLWNCQWLTIIRSPVNLIYND